MYLGGFVIECLLKAKLLDGYGWLGNAAFPSGRSKSDQRIWSLCYRSHDLDEILARLPQLEQRLESLDQQGSPRLLDRLKSICAQWTIQARYSPLSADISDAREFLGQIEEVKEWLK